MKSYIKFQKTPPKIRAIRILMQSSKQFIFEWFLRYEGGAFDYDLEDEIIPLVTKKRYFDFWLKINSTFLEFPDFYQDFKAEEMIVFLGPYFLKIGFLRPWWKKWTLQEDESEYWRLSLMTAFGFSWTSSIPMQSNCLSKIRPKIESFIIKFEATIEVNS